MSKVGEHVTANLTEAAPVIDRTGECWTVHLDGRLRTCVSGHGGTRMLLAMGPDGCSFVAHTDTSEARKIAAALLAMADALDERNDDQ